jgi:hypothetical protein
MGLTKEKFRCGVAILILFAGPPLRAQIFAGIQRSTRPGGLILLQRYRLEQIALRQPSAQSQNHCDLDESKRVVAKPMPSLGRATQAMRRPGSRRQTVTRCKTGPSPGIHDVIGKGHRGSGMEIDIVLAVQAGNFSDTAGRKP